MVECVQIGDATLYQGDCLAVLPTLPASSVQLILCDPPYGGKKLNYLGEQLTWDRQWLTQETYLSWIGQLAKEWQRVLAPNGSLYCFASPDMAAWVEVTLSKVFHVLNQIVWRKHDGSGAGTGTHSKVCRERLRSYFPQTERIIFCEQPDSDAVALGKSRYAVECETLHGHVFESLRAYLDGERRRAGIEKAACNAACGFAAIPGGMASRHYFSASQWELPTRDHYASLQVLFNRDGHRPAPPFTAYHPVDSAFAKFHVTSNEFLRADYESLRADYESLRRSFTISTAVPYTDVWDFATLFASSGKHPCEKPLALLRHMILTSSRPGDTVLDCCAGSFSTLEAARDCGRKGIGIENDARWFRAGQARLAQIPLFLAEGSTS